MWIYDTQTKAGTFLDGSKSYMVAHITVPLFPVLPILPPLPILAINHVATITRISMPSSHVVVEVTEEWKSGAAQLIK